MAPIGPIARITVHCSATAPGWMAGDSVAAQVAEIRRWHTDKPPGGRGWADIGYHYLIGRGGRVMPGRPVMYRGAHVRGYNRGNLGLCLIGGLGATAYDRFTDHFTEAQDRALRALLADLTAQHPAATVHGHNEFAAKACPGFQVSEWLDYLPVSRIEYGADLGARPLGRGDAGGDVADLQARLMQEPGIVLEIDGQFGPLTEAAVRAFQRAHGLAADGIAGARTFAAMGVGDD